MTHDDTTVLEQAFSVIAATDMRSTGLVETCITRYADVGQPVDKRAMHMILRR